MIELINEISQNFSYDGSKVKGYTQEECRQISSLYDINIYDVPELYRFLTQMGRCSGGLIGDDPIILYRNHWSVRTQVFFQNSLYECLKENRIYGYLKHKPFTFSLESETQYYFLLTSGEVSKTVHHYDDNNALIKDTGLTFVEYMRSVVNRYSEKNSVIVCEGELIII